MHIFESTRGWGLPDVESSRVKLWLGLFLLFSIRPNHYLPEFEATVLDLRRSLLQRRKRRRETGGHDRIQYGRRVFFKYQRIDC